MAICKLVIASSVDGLESRFVRMGKLENAEGAIRLFYREENAEVCVTLQGGRATVRRQGDYSLFLSLTQGEKTEGSLSLGGAEGEVSVYTHRVEYSYKEEALTLLLEYELLFGEDGQSMRLDIEATTRGKV